MSEDEKKLDSLERMLEAGIESPVLKTEGTTCGEILSAVRRLREKVRGLAKENGRLKEQLVDLRGVITGY